MKTNPEKKQQSSKRSKSEEKSPAEGSIHASLLKAKQHALSAKAAVKMAKKLFKEAKRDAKLARKRVKELKRALEKHQVGAGKSGVKSSKKKEGQKVLVLPIAKANAAAKSRLKQIAADESSATASSGLATGSGGEAVETPASATV